MGLLDLFKSGSISAERVTGAVQPSPEKTAYVYKPSIWDRVFTSAPATWLEEKLTPANQVIDKVGGVAGTIGAVNSGLKWGLIVAGLLLALFIIAEYKTLVRN